jgi:hypothetical protein
VVQLARTKVFASCPNPKCNRRSIIVAPVVNESAAIRIANTLNNDPKHVCDFCGTPLTYYPYKSEALDDPFFYDE